MWQPFGVDSEDRLCERYEAKLSASAAIDPRSYLNPCPSRQERSEYAARQEQLQDLRLRFYAELVFVRTVRQRDRCRFFLRRSRHSGF